MVLSIQEMTAKLEKLESVKGVQESLNQGYFDYNEVNVFGKGWLQKEQRIEPVGREDAQLIMESVKAIPLREFLAKSTVTGGSYLIPTKIYQTMFEAATAEDIVADISIAMIPADQIGGTTMKVDVEIDDSYKPKKFSSGGSMPTETMNIKQATLDFSTIFGINLRITNDLIEDSQFDVMEMHIRNAGREMGEFATNEAVMVMMTSTDGDGTLNTEGAGSDETNMADVWNAYNANVADKFVSDIYLTSRHPFLHSVVVDTTYTPYAQTWHDAIISTTPTTVSILGMKIIFNECDALTKALGVNNAFEDLNSYVFAKNYALLSGRKRWLRIENYSDPIRDLVGATVTARQDTVSVYNDSICRIRET